MRKVSPLLSILAISLLALSCSEENPTTGPEGWQELTSPFNTLWDVRYSFNHYLEIDAMGEFSTLIANDFMFYFDPEDIGNDIDGYIIPAFWGKDEFTRAVNNMFNHAYDITLDIPVLEQGEEAFGKPADGNTVFSKSNVSTNIIVMVDENNGYQAQDTCDFEFAKGADGLWQLCELKDHAPYLICTDASSLGKILARFN